MEDSKKSPQGDVNLWTALPIFDSAHGQEILVHPLGSQYQSRIISTGYHSRQCPAQRNRHFPGMLAYRDCFYIIRYYPDRAFFSQPYKWEDKETAWSALRDAVAGLKARPFTTNQFASIESKNRRGQARLQFCLSGDFASSDAQVYQLFDLHRGHCWRRNAYVA